MSEPFVVSVATKTITSLSADSIKHAASSLKRYYTEADALVVPDRSSLHRILHVVEKELVSDGSSSDEFLAYVRSPECVTYLEHMLAFKLGRRVVDADGPLYYELANGADSYGVDREQARSLFRVLESVATLVIKASKIVEGDVLEPGENTKAATIVSESALLAIEGHVRLLSQREVQSVEVRRETLESYKRSVCGVLGRIQPPNFDGTKNVPIESLFVLPSLQVEDQVARQISIDELLALPRTVVLGDPGGGKTTLAKKIASSMAIGTLSLYRGDAGLIPYMVILREYGAELTGNALSVVEFIVKIARVTFQVNISHQTVEWTLATGQAYVLFDGLDELLKTDSRQRIADAITAFSIQYPNVQILVTSRRVGYDQAPLPTEMFGVVGLGDLDELRVASYVENWFKLEESLSEAERERVVASFLAESETVGDLRKNPLMLALMCTIYRAEGYIPRNRPDMYEKCSRMLFDRWDRHRGLLEPFEFEAHVEPALMSIAYSIFCEEKHQAGVPESHLVDLAADYLHKWQYSDRTKAISAARTFIEFCRGRAWVFSDVGLDEQEHSLFQFTHRTFLEYFAAAHLSRTNASLDELCRLLLPKVEKSEWDVVAQLALQIKSKPLEGGADIVLRKLAARIEATGSVAKVKNLVPFVARCLGFMVVSPDTIVSVSRVLVKAMTKLVHNNQGMLARDAGWDLYNAATETRETLMNCVAGEFINVLVSAEPPHEYDVALAWSFGSHVDYDLRSRYERIEELNSAIRSILEVNSHWRWAAALDLFAGKVSPRQMAAKLNGDLVSEYAVPSVGISLNPPPLRALRHVLYARCDDKERCEDYFQLLTIAAHALIDCSGSNVNRSVAGFVNSKTFVPSSSRRYRHRPLSSEEIVAAALILAWYTEEVDAGEVGLFRRLGRSRLSSVRGVFAQRFLGRSDKSLSVSYDGVAGWETLVKWADKELSFFA